MSDKRSENVARKCECPKPTYTAGGLCVCCGASPYPTSEMSDDWSLQASKDIGKACDLAGRIIAKAPKPLRELIKGIRGAYDRSQSGCHNYTDWEEEHWQRIDDAENAALKAADNVIEKLPGSISITREELRAAFAASALDPYCCDSKLWAHCGHIEKYLFGEVASD
jgi:hypothetical protein